MFSRMTCSRNLGFGDKIVAICLRWRGEVQVHSIAYGCSKFATANREDDRAAPAIGLSEGLIFMAWSRGMFRLGVVATTKCKA
jgi:hypothetical protein